MKLQSGFNSGEVLGSRTILSVACAAIVLLLVVPGIAFPQARVTSDTEVSTIVRILPDQISDADFDRIESNEAAIMKLADLYNFNPTKETFVPSQALRCPLWTKRLLVEFSSLESIRVPSVFIAVISKRDGAFDLIPVSNHGLGPLNYDAAFDPHNIAIFNQTVEEERPSLDQKAKWIQLAGCYLDLMARFPRLAFQANLQKLIGVHDEDVLRRLAPAVQMTAGGADVTIYDVIADERYFIRWELGFDKDGYLRNIRRARERPRQLLGQ